MLRIKDEYIFEDYIVKLYEDEADVKAHIEEGKSAIEAIMITYPNRYVGAGRRQSPKKKCMPQHGLIGGRTITLSARNTHTTIFSLHTTCVNKIC